MKLDLLYKQISLVLFGLTITSCDSIERALESRVTTNVDVTVVNQGSEAVTAYAVATQKYDANHCSHNGQARSNPVLLGPGESSRVSTSIECNQMVKGWVTIYKQSHYDVGYILITNSTAAFFLKPGLQFRVTDKNHQYTTSIQIVNATYPHGNYDHYWSLSPTGTSQVAWVDSRANSGYSSFGKLYFSLPKNHSPEMEFVEFDDSLGISDFGPGPLEHVNGVYRGHFIKVKDPFISSDMSRGSLFCDDIGCNEN